MTRLEMLKATVRYLKFAVATHGPIAGYVASLALLEPLVELVESGKVAERWV